MIMTIAFAALMAAMIGFAGGLSCGYSLGEIGYDTWRIRYFRVAAESAGRLAEINELSLKLDAYEDARACLLDAVAALPDVEDGADDGPVGETPEDE